MTNGGNRVAKYNMDIFQREKLWKTEGVFIEDSKTGVRKESATSSGSYISAYGTGSHLSLYSETTFVFG